MNKRLAVNLLLGLLLSGCAVGPDYVKPTLKLPASFKEDGRWKIAQPKDEYPRGAWWHIYQDPQLDQLMATLNRQSPTIAQAEAQYRSAQALLKEADAGLYPSLSASTSRSRTVSSPGTAANTVYLGSLNASWEMDLWGSIRRTIEADQAKQEASAAQLAAIRLSSQAQLASAYLQLVVADQQINRLQQSMHLLEQTLTLTRNQFAAGIISDANVAQAESAVESARAQLTDKQLTRSQLEHAIAASLGETPAELSFSSSHPQPYLPEIPAGVPSQLLERRPDIASAERTVAAANAQIGVAEAAFFPTLTLSASGGYRSNDFSQWATLPNRIWSIGPQAALTLFDGGLRKAQKEAAIANYDASVASYRSTALAAFQAVEDDLAAQRLLSQEAEQQQRAFQAASRAEQIALNEYKAGTVSYLNVLTAQNSRITAENTLWNVKNRQYVSSVALIASLGGVW